MNRGPKLSEPLWSAHAADGSRITVTGTASVGYTICLYAASRRQIHGFHDLDRARREAQRILDEYNNALI
jgi:hypothetical protein